MQAWERYLTGDTQAVAAVCNFVVASWQRSLQSGVNPTGCAAPLAARGDAVERLRWQHRDLLWAAANLFADATDLLAGSRSIMLLTNPAGIVLEAAGDMQTMEQGQDIHLMQGGDWSEAVIGTNGIGTALATGRPAQIHAAEHFCEGIKGWTCAGAPICEPGTRTIMGVIDISGPPLTYQRNNLSLAVAAARQIEMVLAERIARERMRLLEVCLQRLSSTDAASMIAIDRCGRLLHASGKVPLPVVLGERVPGFNAGAAVEDWAHRLPEGLRAEWFNPVVVDGATIGAVLVIPGHRARSQGSRCVEQCSEVDPERNTFAHIVGRGPVMAAAIDWAHKLAVKRVPVLIEGETGAGKELFARAIHGEEKSQNPYIAFDCGAASKDLIASELFGHVRGAFTGATSEGRLGRFELAHGGTLCLDEIGELPLDLQPMLLRVLEEGVLYRLGDTQPRRVDVRLLALTNRDLLEEVAAGRFRRDLYYRISVTRIRVPPLREREADIDTLVEHFNKRLARRHAVQERNFSPVVMAALRAYSWPGNVRELRNVVESLLLTSSDALVRIDELPAELLAESAIDGVEAEPLKASASLEDGERLAILRTVQNFHGNLAKAARLLGISRSTLYRKIERYHLEI